MVKPMLSSLCDKTACLLQWCGSARLSTRKVVAFVLLGAVTTSLAAYSAYAKRVARTTEASEAFALAGPFDGMQISNRASKANSLLVKTALTASIPPGSYQLASIEPDAVPAPSANPAAEAVPSTPTTEVAAPPAAAAEETPAPKITAPKAAAVAPTPAPPVQHAKPAEKLAKAVPPPHAENNLLDDSQIAALKGRLRLTEDQAGYWPAVEEALRDVVRTQLRGSAKPGHRVAIDVNSDEVQKLIWAAMPLLMRLREDQKGEVRKLARVIGLEQVASQI